MKILAVLVLAMLATTGVADVYHRVVYYCHTNGVDNPRFALRDDGQGVYIWQWDVALPQPSIADLPDDAASVAWVTSQIPPQDFPGGIAIPASGTNNPYMRIEATSAGEVIAYAAHSLPYDAAKAESNRVAEIVKRNTLRGEARTVRTNMIANINDMQSTAALTNGFTAAQDRALANDLRRELIDTQRELRDLAGIVRQLLAAPKD